MFSVLSIPVLHVSCLSISILFTNTIRHIIIPFSGLCETRMHNEQGNPSYFPLFLLWARITSVCTGSRRYTWDRKNSKVQNSSKQLMAYEMKE